MIEYAKCLMEDVAIHHVGNSKNEGELMLSKTALELDDDDLKMLLQKFFLQGFSNPEYYNFTFSNGDFSLNPLYRFAQNVFANPELLFTTSIDIAQHLFAITEHPNIKNGDLFVAYFKGVFVEDTCYEALGIFKSENKSAFLKLDHASGNFQLNHEDGINVEKLDKGCLIFNIDEDDGFKVCILDKSNRSIEAHYWRDNFLNLSPCADEFHQTKEFMTLTKNFVAKQLPEEFEVSKADQIDMLNRSMDYFKKHEQFDKEDFEDNVLQEKTVIESFRSYDKAYCYENELEIQEKFEISEHAVKKQSRAYKSVLKLDKNFHIYIHGNREMIEQGEDANGRKFYKIYYEEEN